MEVYWNLHKDKFSMRDKGIVQSHADAVLMRNVKFVVQTAGRAKVLLEQKKNVHAFVRGEKDNGYSNISPLDWPSELVKYNPYKGSTFVSLLTGEPIYEADLAWMVIHNGKPEIYCTRTV